MLLVIGRGLMTVTSKLGYWKRLQAFASFKFGDSMKKLSKLTGTFTESKQGKRMKKFMSTKYGRTISGITSTEIAYEGLMWLISDDEESAKQGVSISKVSLISSSYMKETFVKYLSFLLEKDVVLGKRLKKWDVKLYIMAGKNDKSCRIMIKPAKSAPVVLATFNVINWINKEKFSKGDLKRLSDVLEYEYFHTAYLNPLNKKVADSSLAYKDNILISDKIDVNKVKATMAYSAVLNDLRKLDQGSLLVTKSLPSIEDIDYGSMNLLGKILEGSYTKQAIKKIRVHQIAEDGPTDVSSISRANKMKDLMYDNISKLDFQEAGLDFIDRFMTNFSTKLTLITYPTKFNSEDFDSDGVRKQDDYKAMILADDDDLNKLGSLLMDKRTKISSSPGLDKGKIQKAREFMVDKGAELLKSRGKSTGNDTLDGLMSIMTGGD